VSYYFNLQAVTLAIELIRIFCIQGALMILQSDNGWEFVAAVIVEVMALWPDVVRKINPQETMTLQVMVICECWLP
jgi:hypothetical protein